jgi:2-C-methyl-D-erythritol 4-phosphate cytidylyltransferase
MTPITPTHTTPARYVALIPAAGVGARMSQGDAPSHKPSFPKQYLPLSGHPMIWHAIAALAAVPQIERVFVVISAGDTFWDDADFTQFADKLTVLRCGGETRSRSVCNGLRAISAMSSGYDAATHVLVHDAARPCLTVALVSKLIDEVAAHPAGGLLAVPVADTLKRRAEASLERVATTVAREGLWQAQTPQLFAIGPLLDALEFAPGVTDESSAMEALRLQPRLVESDSTNFKVTYPRDLALAELILRDRADKEETQ